MTLFTALATSRGAPTDYWVSRVTASVHDLDRAYISYTGYREDDFGAFLYVSEDTERHGVRSMLACRQSR